MWRRSSISGRGAVLLVDGSDDRPPADLVRETLQRDATKELAVEAAGPLDDWSIGRTERQCLIADLEALQDLPPPAVDDDFGL